MSSRREDQPDESVAQARDADDRWAQIPRVVEEATRRAEDAAKAAGRARAQRAHVAFQAQEAERAWQAQQQELAELAQTARELAENAQKAHLVEEQASRTEHARRLEELSALQELAREIEARKVRLAPESRHLQDVAREAAGAAADARENEQAARAQRSQKVQEARAAHEALVEAEARSTEAIERANRLATLAGDAVRRQQEAHDEEKVLVAKLVRKAAEIRHAEAQKASAHARKMMIARELQEILRGIEAFRDIQGMPEDREAPAPDPSGPTEEERPEARGIDRREDPSDSDERTIVLPEAPERPPPSVADGSQGASRPPSRTVHRPTAQILLVVALVLASLVAFSLSRSSSLGDVEPPSRVRLLGGSAPAEDTPSEGGPLVPRVAGLSISEARDRLLQASLTLDQVLPTHGPPGIVVRADPASGRVLPAGAAVSLFVGVEPDRLKQELEGL